MNTESPLVRRDVLRGLLLGAGMLSALPVLAACGDAGGAGGGGAGGPGGGGTGGLTRSGLARTTPAPGALEHGVHALWALTESMAGRALAADDANLVCSPASVEVALTMAANGARGSTLAELLSVLGGLTLADLDAGLGLATSTLESRSRTHQTQDGKPGEVVLTLANAVWGQRGVAWEQAFLDDLARWFGTGVRESDFAADSEQARREINRWVAGQTRDTITELVPGGVLVPSTRMVLVNALYLKAPWAQPFIKEETQEGDFTGPRGRVRVPLMQQTVSARVGTGSGWTAATLPYLGGELAMTLVLPERSDAAGFAALVDPARGGLRAVLSRVAAGESRQVGLVLPRWRFRSRLSLRQMLTALGMPTAFGDTADFSGMTTQQRLQISHVLHEGFIAVDEAGTEASAATAVVMREVSAPVQDLRLVLDRPFLFVIHDVATSVPLFVGRVSDPTAS